MKKILLLPITLISMLFFSFAATQCGAATEDSLEEGTQYKATISNITYDSELIETTSALTLSNINCLFTHTAGKDAVSTVTIQHIQNGSVIDADDIELSFGSESTTTDTDGVETTTITYSNTTDEITTVEGATEALRCVVEDTKSNSISGSLSVAACSDGDSALCATKINFNTGGDSASGSISDSTDPLDVDFFKFNSDSKAATNVEITLFTADGEDCAKDDLTITLYEDDGETEISSDSTMSGSECASITHDAGATNLDVWNYVKVSGAANDGAYILSIRDN